MTERSEGAPSHQSDLPDWVPSLDRPRSLTALRWGIRMVVALALVGFFLVGANGPDDPALLPPGVTQPAGVNELPTTSSVAAAVRTALPGFGETRITVRTVDGQALAFCVLVAETDEQRARGLMTVTDPALGGYDGMLFRYDVDTTTSFYMRNTPMPLSIAFIEGAGQLVSTADMVPCEDVEGCPLYAPAGPFRFSIEVPQGGLGRLGIAPGATVTDERGPCV